MKETAPGDGELSIQLDLGGLAALLRAVEAALQTGRGELRSGSGVTLSGGSTPIDRVTVKITRPKDEGDERADPPIPAELAPA